jgi:hypothetical protein
MRASLALLVLVPALSGCHREDHHLKDSSTFNKRLECAKLATSDKWDDVVSGPYLDSTYYSPARDTCIYVMKTSFPSEKDRNIQSTFMIVDALTRKQIWMNDPQTGETEEQLNAKLDEELKKLQINP